jgi:hypothetical protein
MIRPYNFKNVNLILNSEAGQHYVTGFANGSEIVAERNSDKYTPHVGAKGDTTFAATNDDSGTITFTLKTDSPSNKVLSKLSKGDTTFDTQIVDGNDNSKGYAGGTDCIIMKPANFSRGAEIGEREWVIGVPNLDMEDE